MPEEKPGQSSQPFKVENEHVITALREELAASQDNRLFLLATIKQFQAEYQQALAVWEAEKQSLLAKIEAQAADVTPTKAVSPVRTVPTKVVPAKSTANGRTKGRAG